MGIGLVVVGVIYLIKPTIFRRWFWTRTSIAQRLLSPEHYVLYMRTLGAASVLLGVALTLAGATLR